MLGIIQKQNNKAIILSALFFSFSLAVYLSYFSRFLPIYYKIYYHNRPVIGKPRPVIGRRSVGGSGKRKERSKEKRIFILVFYQKSRTETGRNCKRTGRERKEDGKRDGQTMSRQIKEDIVIIIITFQ